jgi:mRNA-degrading endonuclease toxin of MazEF toxin-antitoxin module
MTYVEVRNAAGAPINVTVETPIVQDGLALADLVVAIPATTGVKRIGPFPNSIYKQADGTVNINFSAVASVTCGAFKVPRA